MVCWARLMMLLMKNAVGVAEGGDAAPDGGLVADFEGGAGSFPCCGCVDEAVEEDVVDFQAAGVQKADDVVSACAMAAHVAQGDVANVIASAFPLVGCADHEGFLYFLLHFFSGTGCWLNATRSSPGVAGDGVDGDVVAALAQVESVLVEDGLGDAVDHLVTRLRRSRCRVWRQMHIVRVRFPSKWESLMRRFSMRKRSTNAKRMPMLRQSPVSGFRLLRPHRFRSCAGPVSWRSRRVDRG